MKKEKRLKWIGCFLVLTGLGALALYWAVVLPILLSSHFGLDEDRSPAHFWKQKQRCLKVGVVFHDDGWCIGKLGGKDWFLHALERIKNRDGLSCAGGHMDIALSYLTNHDFGDAPEVIQQAEEWWSTHKHQSQEDWVREGFAVKGIDIQMPPPKEEWPKLLSVLGKKSATEKRWDGTMANEYEEHICYNAYRTLRDSGFEPVAYLIEKSGEKVDPEVIEALKTYQSCDAQFASSTVGGFCFAKPDEWSPDSLGLRAPLVATVHFRSVFSISCVGVGFLGLALIIVGKPRLSKIRKTEALSDASPSKCS